VTVPTRSSSNKEKEVTAYRRPDANVFTLLLVVALVALIIGCIFLYVEMRAYEFKSKVTWQPVPAQRAFSQTTPIAADADYRRA
jgi:hypothetical protein